MTEWKPEKNVSSPWDVDVWENNIGQPVSDTYISLQGTKWYDVDATKLNSAKDIAEFLTVLEIRVSEDAKNFDKFKKFLIIPEKPKTLEEIKEEFDEKIDKLIEKTKEKFEYSKIVAEKRYKYEFDKIFERFEYAKDNGHFPLKLKLTYGTGLSVGVGSCETCFVIKQGSNSKGYYTIGNGTYFKFYISNKPNMIVRFFMKTCLGFVWVDEK